MPNRIGVDAESLKVLSGWDHVRQSMTTILETQVGSRVMLRDFGSDVVDMIDKPQNLEWLVTLYQTAAEALSPRMVRGRQYGEPGFELHLVQMAPSANGKITVELQGSYFEKGHLGDFTVSERRAFQTIIS
jgi:uncharacterized protein